MLVVNQWLGVFDILNLEQIQNFIFTSVFCHLFLGSIPSDFIFPIFFLISSINRKLKNKKADAIARLALSGFS